jgi:peptide/nickel transport system substrate-binding protein
MRLRRLAMMVSAGVLATMPLAAGARAAGNLVIAMPASDEPNSLDGQLDPFQSTWLIDSLIGDPLLVLAPDGTYKPDLALSWDASPDGRDWTFHLRSGATFQDGTPVDAAAVKYNFDRVVDPKSASVELASDLGPIKSVEAIGTDTVKVHYDTPWVTLLDAVRRMSIWSPAAAQKWGIKDFQQHLVGAGPFTFAERVPNDHLTLKRWANYGGWNSVQAHPGPVALDSVTFRFIGESAVLGNMVETGDANIAYELPAQYISDYRNSHDYTLLTKGQAGTGLQMVDNIRHPPLSDINVRKALLFGTNPAAVNKLLYDDTYETMHGPLNAVHPCFWSGVNTMYPFDQARARALLDAAGWKLSAGDPVRHAAGVAGVADGTPLKLRWTVLHHQEIGEAIQAQLAAIGVQLVVEVVPGPVQIDRVNRRDFDLMYERQRSPDPLILDQVWNSRWDKPGGWAWTGFKDATLDTTLDKLRSEPDFAKRCQAADDAQRIIMENALIVPTLSDPVFTALSAHVHGFVPGSDGAWFFLNNVTLDE